MPTPNPRLSVVVSQEQHELLTDLAGLENRSAASYVRQLLDGATPLLRSLRDVMSTITPQDGRSVDKLVSEALTGAYADDPDQLDLLGHFAATAGGADRTDRSVSEDRADRTAPSRRKACR